MYHAINILHNKSITLKFEYLQINKKKKNI